MTPFSALPGQRVFLDGRSGVVGHLFKPLTVSVNWNGDRNVTVCWDDGTRTIERLSLLAKETS